MSVCVYVCLKINDSGTAGLIWLNFCLLAPTWSRDGFKPKNLEKSVLTKLRYFYKNLQVSM